MNKLRDVFGLNNKSYSKTVCDTCKVREEWKNVALYGSISDRNYMKIPRECIWCEKYKQINE